MTKVALTNEILGSMLSDDAADKGALQADPKSYIFSNYNVDITVDIGLAENTDSEVHLTLPYYSAVENFNAEQYGDAEMAEVAGGDIITAIALAIVVASSVAAVGAVAGAAGGAIAATKASNK